MLNKKIKQQWFIFFTKRDYPERLEKIKYKFTQEQYNNILKMFESDDYKSIRLVKEIILRYEKFNK